MDIQINSANKGSFIFKAVKATKDHKHFTTQIVGMTIKFAIDPSQKFDGCLFIRKLSSWLVKLKQKNFDFRLDSFLDLIPKNQQTNMCFAMVCKLGSFNFREVSWKTKKEKYELEITVSQKYEKIFKLAKEVGLATHYAQYAQIAPSNHMGIQTFITYVKQRLNGLKNVKVSLLGQSELKKMQLLQAVNKGSDEQAQVLILEYYNNKSTNKKIALVGKGIMMDTGGYCLKPSRAMKKMNEDMTNAAAVFGTILALAKNNTKVNAVGVIPLAKNFINDKAYKVGDVYTAYNGKTVEINDTDAEGRLILADAISYTSAKIQPTILLSCATLTGLSALCFGDILNPFWSTNSSIAKDFYDACTLSGEYAISLPLLPEYFEQVEKSSSIADYGNLFGKTAGNATAAAFLSKFDSKHDNFIHLDNAGTNEFNGHSINPFVLIFYNFVMNFFINK